jgi:small subunit ribosomal protein S20
MANHKSAIKRHKQSIVRRERNRSRRSEVRTAFKKALAAAEAGQVDEAKQLAREAEALMASAATRHVVHPATMQRRVSRLFARVNSAGAPKA